jgi:hypothetical protein
MLFGPRFSRVHVRGRVASLQLLRFAASGNPVAAAGLLRYARDDEGQGDLTT